MPDPTASVLAIDPGSAKCGIAVVQRDGTVLFRAVVPAEVAAGRAGELAIEHSSCAIVVGNGTASKPLLLRLQAAGLTAPIIPIDESYTSEAARARYLSANPPRGWERLLPRSLRSPTVPYDDYVAIILAERYWLTQT